MTILWRVHYDDGRTVSNLETAIEDVPGVGILVIAQFNRDVGRELLCRKHFYYWERGLWWGCDLFGLWDYLTRPGWKKVLHGRNIEHNQFSACYERARLDPDLPAKSALLPSEVEE